MCMSMVPVRAAGHRLIAWSEKSLSHPSPALPHPTPPPPQGFPTIKVFGADKRNPTDYKGERSATAIVTGGMAAARELVKLRQGGGSKKKPAEDSSKGPSPS